MRIAILETIVMPAGHEVEFDRILVEELKKQGHAPRFFVPENFPFKIDYHVPVDYLRGGEAVSYAGAGRLKKLWLSVQREKRRIAWLDDAAAKAQSGLCDAIIVPTNSWRVMRSIKKSDIKHSTVPVLFMFHGIMPADRQRFVEGVRSLKMYKNIHLGALGLQTEFPELKECPNFHVILAPVYVPFDLPVQPELIIFSMANPSTQAPAVGFFTSRPAFISALASTSLWAALMSHSGIRSIPASRPIMFSATLTGMGLTSMNRASTRPMVLTWSLAASSNLPSRHS